MLDKATEAEKNARETLQAKFEAQRVRQTRKIIQCEK